MTTETSKGIDSIRSTSAKGYSWTFDIKSSRWTVEWEGGKASSAEVDKLRDRIRKMEESSKSKDKPKSRTEVSFHAVCLMDEFIEKDHFGRSLESDHGFLIKPIFPGKKHGSSPNANYGLATEVKTAWSPETSKVEVVRFKGPSGTWNSANANRIRFIDPDLFDTEDIDLWKNIFIARIAYAKMIAAHTAILEKMNSKKENQAEHYDINDYGKGRNSEHDRVNLPPRIDKLPDRWGGTSFTAFAPVPVFPIGQFKSEDGWKSNANGCSKGSVSIIIKTGEGGLPEHSPFSVIWDRSAFGDNKKHVVGDYSNWLMALKVANLTFKVDNDELPLLSYWTSTTRSGYRDGDIPGSAAAFAYCLIPTNENDDRGDHRTGAAMRLTVSEKGKVEWTSGSTLDHHEVLLLKDANDAPFLDAIDKIRKQFGQLLNDMGISRELIAARLEEHSLKTLSHYHNALVDGELSAEELHSPSHLYERCYTFITGLANSVGQAPEVIKFQSFIDDEVLGKLSEPGKKMAKKRSP